METALYTPDANHHYLNRQSNAAIGSHPETLTRIFDDTINIAIYQRSLSPSLNQYTQQLIDCHPNFNLRAGVKFATARSTLNLSLPELAHREDFVNDLYVLMDMYACLFDLEDIGLRLQVLDKAMCPRFHTDKLGCRLITTYQGEGTEWLCNEDVDRSKLGMGSCGLDDRTAGLYLRENDIQQVNTGDIVLLKGEGWINNEGQGIVHRSPTVQKRSKRVVVTMDFA